MSRNLKPEYINKIRKTPAPNGYIFDIANYLYNPSLDNEYPSFKKLVSSDENTETYSRIYYFKYWDGSGEYKEEIFTREKNGKEWQIVKNRTEKTLETSNRFSLKRLLEHCAEATYEN